MRARGRIALAARLGQGRRGRGRSVVGGGGGAAAGTRDRHARITLEGAAAGAGDLPVLATPLDAFVGVLVQRCKILPQFLVGGADGVSLADARKLLRQSLEGAGVEFILMRLDVQDP